MHQRLRDKLAKLDLDRLQEVLDYEPETGVFMWRVRLSPACKMGVPAGTVSVQGYLKISIDHVSYPAHHLAWYHFYGVPAEKEIDPINLKKDDIRISNLRLATRSENCRNKRRTAANTTGYKGVAVFNSPRNLKHFRSSIRVDGKRIHLGQFSTAEEAYEAYCKKVKELHGEFARTE